MPPRFGAVRANGKMNICAELHEDGRLTTSDLRRQHTFHLSAAGEDAEGDDLEFLWTAEGGVIADDSAAQTTFTCPKRARVSSP